MMAATNKYLPYHSLLTISAAELATLLVSFLSLGLFHIDLALRLVQVIATDLMVLVPIVVLIHYRPKRLSSYAVNRQLATKIAVFGLVASALAYGNYLFFFVRHSLSPQFLDHKLPLYQQATTVTCLTLVLCLLINLFFEKITLPSDKRMLATIVSAWATSIILIYSPLQTIFGMRALDIIDWLTALAAALLFAALRFSQRHTRKHSRKAVVELHRQIHGA